MTINNLPKEYHEYVVARNVDGEYWYWGSFKDYDKAYEAARTIGGVVFSEQKYAALERSIK